MDKRREPVNFGEIVLLNPGLTHQVKQINNDILLTQEFPLTCPVNVVPEADKYGCI